MLATSLTSVVASSSHPHFDQPPLPPRFPHPPPTPTTTTTRAAAAAASDCIARAVISATRPDTITVVDNIRLQLFVLGLHQVSFYYRQQRDCCWQFSDGGTGRTDEKKRKTGVFYERSICDCFFSWRARFSNIESRIPFSFGRDIHGRSPFPMTNTFDMRVANS